MKSNSAVANAALKLGGIALIGAAGVVFTGLTAGSAAAAPGDNLPENCVQFSQDGGAVWGDANVVAWNSDKPIPGGEIKHAAFRVKNICDDPGKLQVYAGNWSVSGGGSATVRANAGAAKSAAVPLAGGPGILVVETGRLKTNEAVAVELFVGIPKSETKQGFTITPNWSIAVEEVAPGAPTDPGAGGSGSLGDAGGSSAGSLGDLVGGIFGSGSAASAVTSLDAPTVSVRR